MSSRNAAVAMLLSNLREELLVPPREEIAEAHRSMMRLEQQVLTTSDHANPLPARRPVTRLSVPARVRRAATTNPRRFAALVAALSLLLGSLGLNAAGALPDAFHHLSDHITNTIVHTFDTPQPPQPGTTGHNRSDRVTTSSAPGSRGAHEVALGARRTGTGSTTTPTSTDSGAGSSPGPTTSSSSPTGGSQSPGTPTGSYPLPKKTMQKDPGPPPGFSSNWRELALNSARAQLEACVQAAALAPSGCPQRPDGVGVIATPATVQWSLLNQPLAGASAIAQSATIRANASASAGTQVTVYGLFQMEATYTEPGDPQPYYAYSGGVAQATMVWNGSSFQNVGFVNGSVAGEIPPGIPVQQFQPPGFTDTALRDAVSMGFEQCAAIVAPANEAIPNCPQTAIVDPAAIDLLWTLNGDPLQGAVITFDHEQGDYTVSGTYEMGLTYDLTSAPPGAPTTGSATVSGSYTATLVANGANLVLIGIAKS